MVTRRAVLTGTAAASIAAIASAHGAATAAVGGHGFDLGFGALEGGAIGGFHKSPDGFGVFMKWHKTGAELFYKTTAPGVVEVFYKTFAKGWTPVTSFFLKFLPTLDGAEAAFQKFDKERAEFFIKGENQVGVITIIENTEKGVQIGLDEVSLDGEIQ